MHKLLSICLAALLISPLSMAQDCTFTSDGNGLVELNLCPSFVNADKSQIRFARIDSVDDDEIFVGPSRYLIDSNTIIYDHLVFIPGLSSCVSNGGQTDIADHVGNDVAFILEDGDQQSDRLITSIWLLDCEITQGR